MHLLRIIIIAAIILLSAPYSFAADVPNHLYVVGCVYSESHPNADSYNFDGVELTREGNTFFGDVEITNYGTSEFAVVAQNGLDNWQKDNYIPLSAINNRAEIQTVSLKLSHDSKTVSRLMPNTYRFLVDFSETEPRLKITKSDYTMDLYVVGALTGDPANPYDFIGEKFDQNIDIFTCSGVELHASSGGMAEFAITQDWESNYAFFTTDRKWDFTNSDVLKKTLVLTEAGKKQNGEVNPNTLVMQITPGTYDFEFDNSGFEPVLTIKKHSISTALPSLTIDDYLPEYYTLTGIRIDAPKHGIYIVRRGASVTKQLIR